jgi:hypothetical protein
MEDKNVSDHYVGGPPQTMMESDDVRKVATLQGREAAQAYMREKYDRLVELGFDLLKISFGALLHFLSTLASR